MSGLGNYLVKKENKNAIMYTLRKIVSIKKNYIANQFNLSELDIGGCIQKF